MVVMAGAEEGQKDMRYGYSDGVSLPISTSHNCTIREEAQAQEHTSLPQDAVQSTHLMRPACMLQNRPTRVAAVDIE
jgi:hypothetical protein